MAIRLKGVCKTVPEKRIHAVIDKLRKKLGKKYEIAIQGNHICVRGDLKKEEIQEEIDKILNGD